MLFRTAFITIIGLTMATSAHARPPAKKGPVAGGPGHQIHKRIKQLRAEVLRYDVGLKPAKAAKVEALMAGYDPVRRKLRERNRMAKRALKRLLRTDSNDQKAFKRVLDDLVDVRGKLEKLRFQQRDALRKMLTPKQQAKLFVALKRMERRVRRAMQELRPRRGPRGRFDGRHRGPRRDFKGPGMRRRGAPGGGGMAPFRRQGSGNVDDDGLL